MKTLTLYIILFFSALTLHAQKGNIMWIDATANFERMSSPDSVIYYLNLCKELGFTDVVIDIKPITGEMLYKSAVAPQMTQWQGFKRSADYDLLALCIEEGHKAGLKVHASLNVFVAGHNFFDRGLVYNGKDHWQSVNYTDSGLVPISKLKHKYSAMTNPALKEVRGHELDVIREVVTRYPQLDGILLDRVRYDGIEADFSSASRSAFESYTGAKVENFPQDIYTYKKDAEGKSIRVPGRFYKQWLEWRASVVWSFFKEAREEVKKIHPNILFGTYTGAWYPLYYEVGANWASDKYDPSPEYEWASAGYKNYGYAGLLDIYTTGCYFFEVTMEEVESNNARINQRTEAAMGTTREYWYSVEGSAKIAMEVVGGAVPVVGGLYIEQYKDHPEQFTKAVQMCLKKTDGLMIFDLVHIVNYGWWEVLQNAMHTN